MVKIIFIISCTLITSIFGFSQKSEQDFEQEYYNSLFPNNQNDFLVYLPGALSSEIYDVRLNCMINLLKRGDIISFFDNEIRPSEFGSILLAQNIDQKIRNLIQNKDLNFDFKSNSNKSFTLYHYFIINQFLEERIIPINQIKEFELSDGRFVQEFIQTYYKNDTLSKNLQEIFLNKSKEKFSKKWQEIKIQLSSKIFNSNDGYQFLLYNELIQFYDKLENIEEIKNDNILLENLNERLQTIVNQKSALKIKFINADSQLKKNINQFKIGILVGAGKVTNLTFYNKRLEFNYNSNSRIGTSEQQVTETSKDFHFLVYQNYKFKKWKKTKINSRYFDAILYIPKIGKKEDEFCTMFL